MLGDEREHAIVDLDRIEGGEAQARQVRDLVQYAFDQKAERRLAGKIGDIARDINAGQPDFPIASIHQSLDLVDYRDRKSVWVGKSVSVRVGRGGLGRIKK